MNTYTIIVYLVPAGSHHIEVIEARDATEAVVRLREGLLLAREECELVAVACGRVEFECVDATQVALAPYGAATVS